MKLHLSISKHILILFLTDKALSQRNCEDYRDRKTGTKGWCMDNEECCSGAAIENICPYHNFCCFGYNKCDVIDNNNDNNKAHGCSFKDMITRNDWGANHSNKFCPNLRKHIEHVFIHHTDDGQSCYSTESCMKRVRNIQSYHQNTKHWQDIAHNFLIGGDGMVYEGRGWGKEGSHTLDWNRQSIGIAFIGNFHIEVPNDDMIDAINYLVTCGVEKGYLSTNFKIHGHRDAMCTVCPGDALYDIIKNSERYTGGKLNPYHCYRRYRRRGY